MIRPYYKNEHNARYVEVEEFGVIDLEKLPINVRQDEAGLCQIVWCIVAGEKDKYVLSEVGGRSSFDFGGRDLGVIRKIHKDIK